MFSAPVKGSHGAGGISALLNGGKGERKTEVSNYQNDFAAVQQYQEMMS
jgi:hypothetical protein